MTFLDHLGSSWPSAEAQRVRQSSKAHMAASRKTARQEIYFYLVASNDCTPKTVAGWADVTLARRPDAGQVGVGATVC